MPRIRNRTVRGRRMAWLLASALPLLATENDEIGVVPASHYNNNNDPSGMQAQQHQQQHLPQDEDNTIVRDDDEAATNQGYLQNLRLPRLSLDWTTQAILATTNIMTNNANNNANADNADEQPQPLPTPDFEPLQSSSNTSSSVPSSLEQQLLHQSRELEWWEVAIREQQQHHQQPNSLLHEQLEWCEAVLDSNNNTSTYVVVNDTGEMTMTNETAAVSSITYYNETAALGEQEEEGREDALVKNETASTEADSKNLTDASVEVSSSCSDSRTADAVLTTPTTSDERFVAAVDYASKSAGGLVLEKSKNFQGTSNLLASDRDRYAIVECEEPTKWVVIGLSEDILVKRVVLASYERYSSHVKEFSLFASTTATEWIELGNFTAALMQGEQAFDIPVPMWARYLKFQFLSHYGQEHYCTVSQIKVHGSTVLQGFHEQWQEHDDENQEKEHDDDERQEGDGAAPVEQQEHPDNTLMRQHSDVSSEATTVHPPDAEQNLASAAASRNETGSGGGGVFHMVPNELDVGKIPDNISCLSSAAVSLASRQFSSELNSPTQYLLGGSSPSWRRRSVWSLCHAALTRRISSVPVCGDYPLVAVTPSDNENNNNSSSPSSHYHHSLYLSLTLPLVNRVQDFYETVGWNISFSGISPLHRSRRFDRKNVENTPASSTIGDSTTEVPQAPHAAAQDTKHQARPLTPSSADAAAEQEPAQELYTETNGVEPGVFVPTSDDKGLSSNPPTTANVEPVTMPTDSNRVLSRLTERIPSASCLKKLENLTALRAGQVKKGSGGGHGSLGGAPTATGGVEPIFKKLTDEIKALQANLAAYDDVTKEAVACYQQVLFDIFADMESHRLDHDARFRKLEQEYFGVRWIIAIRAMLGPIFDWVSLFFGLLLYNDVGIYGRCARIAASSLLVVFFFFKILFWKLGSRKLTARSSSASVASSCSTSPSCSKESPPPLVTPLGLICHSPSNAVALEYKAL